MKIAALKTFMQRVGDRPRLLVKIETDAGIAGWGEAYNHGPDYALRPLLDYLFEQIRGIDPRRIEFVVLKLLQSSRFPPGARSCGDLGDRPRAVGHFRKSRWAACLYATGGQRAGPGAGLLRCLYRARPSRMPRSNCSA